MMRRNKVYMPVLIAALVQAGCSLAFVDQPPPRPDPRTEMIIKAMTIQALTEQGFVSDSANARVDSMTAVVESERKCTTANWAPIGDAVVAVVTIVHGLFKHEDIREEGKKDKNTQYIKNAGLTFGGVAAFIKSASNGFAKTAECKRRERDQRR